LEPEKLNEKRSNIIEILPNKIDRYGTELTCAICQDILFETVSVLPCLHSFCGACFTEWSKQALMCPTCRVRVDAAQKNRLLENLIAIYLSENPSKRRSEEELARMMIANEIKDGIKYNTIADSPNEYFPQHWL
jgi:E3 ubiquitin-protein ligase CHFR